VGKTARDFCDGEVLADVEKLDAKTPGLMQKHMHRAGELGLFMADVPEAQGGLGLEKAGGMLLTESLGSVASFTVTFGAHTGIGTLPLVYYGTQAQQEKYLPRLMSGEWMAAYALSEQGSGSDALGAKTVARLSADGKHYVLNGSKMWITNAAWADLFTVFAQVDGDKFTAFLVERKTAGLSIGHEEHKLGIRGSSTCQIILDDVHVPVDNVLGTIGRGHKIAFNILNIGRYKLGVGAVGLAKYALKEGTQYARDRRQFKRPIASFELIQEKLARSASQIYAGESMCYRLGGDIDARNAQLNKAAPNWGAEAIGVIDELTVEASIIKVFGSELGEYVSDEMLQVHGGNGYTADYPLERVVRDSRINRIFEGTNEINRTIIPSVLVKRSMANVLPLVGLAQQYMQQMQAQKGLPTAPEGPLGAQMHALELSKRAVILALGLAVQTHKDQLKEKQSLLGALADCVIALYGMDSAVARAHQARNAQGQPAGRVELHQALAQLYCFEAQGIVSASLRRAAAYLVQGEAYGQLLRALGHLDPKHGVDIGTLQSQVAEAVLAAGGYPVSI
jgi:alkylation response protein AidB-like acyl-CoA dehydrogenase